MLDLRAEADRLEGAAHALEQSLRPQLDSVKFMREAARRLRAAGKPGPVDDAPLAAPATH